MSHIGNKTNMNLRGKWEGHETKHDVPVYKEYEE